jgi:hypothetical protein
VYFKSGGPQGTIGVPLGCEDLLAGAGLYSFKEKDFRRAMG